MYLFFELNYPHISIRAGANYVTSLSATDLSPSVLQSPLSGGVLMYVMNECSGIYLVLHIVLKQLIYSRISVLGKRFNLHKIMSLHYCNQ